MDIQAEKLEIMKMILETENPLILESVKKLFTKEAPDDFWETISHELKEEIFQGIKEIQNKEVTYYEDFRRKHR